MRKSKSFNEENIPNKNNADTLLSLKIDINVKLKLK